MSCAKPPMAREFMRCGWPSMEKLAGYPPYPPPPPPRFGGKEGFHLLFPSNTPPGSADAKTLNPKPQTLKA